MVSTRAGHPLYKAYDDRDTGCQAIGVHASNEFIFFILGLPSGAYFKETGSERTTVNTVFVARDHFPLCEQGGTGDVKAFPANYAISLHTMLKTGRNTAARKFRFWIPRAGQEVEEPGGMNVFFVEQNTPLHTPPFTDRDDPAGDYTGIR